jgi:DNA mismatch repair protein MutS2
LGLPAEIIQLARSTLDPSELKADDLLDEIHRQRNLARRARGDADRSHYQAEKLRKDLALQLEKLEEERLDILEQTRLESQRRIEALEEELNEARRVIQRARMPLIELQPVIEQTETLKAEVEKPVTRRSAPRPRHAPPSPFRVGQKIKVRSLKTEAVITTLDDEDVEVQIGALRMRTKRTDIQSLAETESEEPAAPVKPKTTVSQPASQTVNATGIMASPGLELDLRGQRAEDALAALDRYLENAYLSGMPFVRIIHGKGTGKLRVAVREALHASPHVSRFESGQDNEGGDGVTIAHLAD